MKTLNTLLSISRVQHCSGGEDDYVQIEIRDVISGITFLETKVTLSNFTLALTALSNVGSKSEVRGLEYLGMRYESKYISIQLPDNMYNSEQKKKIALKRATKSCPKGWQISNYLGSSNSFFRKGEKEFARVEIFRYTKPKGENKNV